MLQTIGNCGKHPGYNMIDCPMCAMEKQQSMIDQNCSALHSLSLKTNSMDKLLTAKEASNLVSGSDERKQQLISIMNTEIKTQSEKGLRWAHLPSVASEFEKEWLRDELVLNGFTVKSDNPVVNW